MTVHKNKTHHRPRVEKLKGPRSRWSFPWKGTCTCGWHVQEMLWRNALIGALTHAEKVL